MRFFTINLNTDLLKEEDWDELNLSHTEKKLSRQKK